MIQPHHFCCQHRHFSDSHLETFSPSCDSLEQRRGRGRGGGDWLDVFIHQYPYVLLAVRVSFRAPAVKTFSSSTFLSLVRKSIHLHLHALPRGCCVCLVPTSFYLMSHFSYEVKLKLKMSAVSAAICGMIEEPQTELKQEQVVISLTPWAASAFTV